MCVICFNKALYSSLSQERKNEKIILKLEKCMKQLRIRYTGLQEWAVKPFLNKNLKSSKVQSLVVLKFCRKTFKIQILDLLYIKT